MQTHNESSVLFNLQELMRIEDDRVEAEQAAARALEEQARQRERDDAAARLRAQSREQEEQRAKAIAAERALADEAARVEIARAVALEQTRLAIEAAERAEQQRLRQQHEATLAALANQSRVTLRHGLAALTVVSGLVALGYFGVVDPMLRHSRSVEAQALALADHYTREIEALREAPVVVRAVAPVAAAPATPELDSEPAGSTSVADATKTKRHRANTRSRTKATNTARESSQRTQRAGNEHVLGALDSEDNDPLRGL